MSETTATPAAQPDLPPLADHRATWVTMWMGDYTAASLIAAYVPVPERRWNGWAVPVFPADTFTRDRTAWDTLFTPVDDEEQTIRWVGDTLSIISHYEGEEDVDDVDTFTIDGVPLVGCGAYGMVWEERTMPNTAPHHHYYSPQVSDWLCRECQTVTDFCTQEPQDDEA